VWVVVLSIAAFIVIIQILNRFAYEENKLNKNLITTTDNSYFNYNYSVITRQEVETNVAEIIDDFIKYCNNGQIEEAYGLLSDECKNVLYPSIEDFKQQYYNKIFTEKKAFLYQAWISQDEKYTYRVNFTTDMLATGSPAKTSIIDYYTLVKNNNEYKLNINKFIGIENINKKEAKDKIEINVKNKKIYMDYEIYDIEVINNNYTTIMLDDMKSTDNIYLEDDNNQKYFWFNNEVIESNIKIRRGYTQEILIKFNKTYNTSIQLERIVFENIILENKPINISVEI